MAQPGIHTPTLIIGLGCRQGCSCDDLLALIQQALDQAAITLSSVHGLASIDLKRDEPGLIQLAARLSLPFEVFSALQLEPFASRLSQHSTVAYQQTGCWGIAESTALALAEQLSGTSAKLIIPRQASSMATFALACAG